MSEEYSTDGIVASTLDLFLRNERLAEGVRPTACGTGLRGSQAYVCDRQIAFQAARVPECEELPYTTLLAFNFGQAMHEKVQASLEALWGDFESEVQVDLRPLGYNCSGHADGHNVIDDTGTVYEIKTMKAYPFKLAKGGEFKIEHALQAGIYALGLGADSIHLVYICKEGNFRDKVTAGDTLEFRIGMDEVLPSYGQTLRSLVVEELDRLQRVWDQVKDGVVPARWIPGHGHVEQVPSYLQKKVSPWNCAYCSFNSACRSMPTEAVPVELAPTAVKESWNPPVEAEVAA